MDGIFKFQTDGFIYLADPDAYRDLHESGTAQVVEPLIVDGFTASFNGIDTMSYVMVSPASTYLLPATTSTAHSPIATFVLGPTITGLTASEQALFSMVLYVSDAAGCSVSVAAHRTILLEALWKYWDTLPISNKFRFIINQT